MNKPVIPTKIDVLKIYSRFDVPNKNVTARAKHPAAPRISEMMPVEDLCLPSFLEYCISWPEAKIVRAASSDLHKNRNSEDNFSVRFSQQIVQKSDISGFFEKYKFFKKWIFDVNSFD